MSHFQNFHLFTAMAAASRDVNKWKRNLTQEMLTEPEEESEPDEPEFETSCRFQQEGDIVAVYNVEDFFISKVTRVISEEEAIVNFLEKAAVKMELLYTGGHALKITLKSPPQLCLPRICNLHLHHCLQGRSFFVESHRNLSATTVINPAWKPVGKAVIAICYPLYGVKSAVSCKLASSELLFGATSALCLCFIFLC